MPDAIWLVAAVLAGLTLGWLMAGLMARRGQQQERNAQEELRRQLVSCQAERDALIRQCDEQVSELQRLRAKVTELTSDRARFEERQEAQQEKLAWLEQSREQLKKEFEHLSGKVLENRGQQLQQQHRQGLDELLKPFREQMADFRRRVDQIHSDDTRAQADLLAQIRNLQSLNNQMVEDARNLTNALKGQNKAQGNWGELILERILEASGLTRGREYDTQVSVADDEGQRKQPDVIVRLPDDKDVIVDSKVSLVAWERYCSSDEEDARREALDQHVSSIRNHVRGLSDKGYQQLDGVRSLDFVLLFIPIEAAFLTALEADQNLYHDAYQRNIVLVSPTTLLVTLRTINNLWRTEYQNRNALEIARRAGKICDQVALVAESLGEVGTRLDQAHRAWQKTSDRLESGRGNLLRQAHQLRDMGAKAERTLPAPRDDEDSDS